MFRIWLASDLYVNCNFGHTGKKRHRSKSVQLQAEVYISQYYMRCNKKMQNSVSLLGGRGLLYVVI